MSLLQRKDMNDPLWHELEFKVFDLVEQPVPFLERKQKMQKIVQKK